MLAFGGKYAHFAAQEIAQAFGPNLTCGVARSSVHTLFKRLSEQRVVAAKLGIFERQLIPARRGDHDIGLAAVA